MNNKIRFLISSYLVFLFLGVVSCDDPCGSNPNRFKLSSLNWATQKAIYISEDYYMNVSEFEGNSVIYNQFGIVVGPERKYYYAENNNNFLKFTTSAYACSPVPPSSIEEILDIEIFSNVPFKTGYTASDNLASLFDIFIYDSRPTHPSNVKLDLIEYLNTNPTFPNSFVLILKEAPDTTGDFAFTVKYYQDGIDLDYFEFTTNPVEIKTD